MSLRRKLQQNTLDQRKRDIITKIGATSEKYRNREMLGFGFPELYLVAKTKYYKVIGEVESIKNIILNTYSKDDFILTGSAILMKDKEKAEELFPGMYVEYSYFKTFVEIAVSYYPETSRRPLRGLAYHISKNLEEQTLDSDTLLFMGETLAEESNIWVTSEKPNVMVNSTTSFADVVAKIHFTPNISKVDVNDITGDLNDLKAALETRIKELRECTTYFEISLGLRGNRGGDKYDPEMLTRLRTELKVLIHSMAQLIKDESDRINKDLNDFDEKRELDFLQRYRGEFSDFTLQPQRISTLVGLGLPKANEKLLEIKDSSDKGAKFESNSRRVKERFDSAIEIEELKLKYVNMLIKEGSISKDTYFLKMFA